MALGGQTIKKPMYVLPVPSTSLEVGTHYNGKKNSLLFEYEKDGVLTLGGFQFNRVAAIRERAERCCTAWHIEEAYDTLVEVEGSPWVDEIRCETTEHLRNLWAMHHYMIYLDSFGCFEVIAESWTAL